MSDSKFIIVSLEEEYGYRHWVWKTGMTKQELKDWWEALETVSPFFYNPGETLPGELIQVQSMSEKFMEEADKTQDRETLEKILAEGVHPSEGWTGHIHEDDDSCLCSPEGEFIFHRGMPEDKKKKFGSEG